MLQPKRCETASESVVGVTVVAMSILVSILPGSALGQPSCGPGAHWIDGCDLGGTDIFPSSGAVVGVDTMEDGNLDGDVDRNLVLFGPTTIVRTGTLDDSANFPGSSPADGHPTGPGLDVIDTEITSMSLTSGPVTLTAGDGQGSGPALPPTGLLPSPGTIVEQGADESLGDSFFDVFFELDLGGGTFLYNQQALRVEAVIDRVPPDTTYFHVITAPIPLFPTPDVQAGQQPLAQLVTARHITMPSALLIPTLSPWGMVVLGLLLVAGAAMVLRRRLSRG